MDEIDWLTASDPAPVLRFLRGRASNRKMAWFAIAAVGRTRAIRSDSLFAEALEVAEKHLDGQVTAEEVWQKLLAAHPHRSLPIAAPQRAAYLAVRASLDDAAAAVAAASAAVMAHPLSRRESERAAQAADLRDHYGNPFRPVAIEPAWKTPAIVALAGTIHTELAYHHLPELGDALEAAGCHVVDVLAHCRSVGPHLRGCWVVAGVLGKE